MTTATSLPDFRLEVYLGRFEFTARYHLTASDAETLTISELLAMASDVEQAAFERLPLSYVPVRGSDRLLDAISRTYESIEPDEVLTFAGAEEALFWAIQELIGPGDHAILTVPNYQSMESVALATGAAVSGLPLRPDTGWSLDLHELEGLLRPETRLVAVNFPNNPTAAWRTPRISGGWPRSATSVRFACSATRSTAGSSSTRGGRSRRPPTSRPRPSP